MATHMPQPHEASVPSLGPPSGPRFRLAFQVVSDGLQPGLARSLDVARTFGIRLKRILNTPDGGSSSKDNDADEGFAQFGRLPPELRLKVWEYLVAPRVVAVACLDAEAEDEEPPEPWTRFPDLTGNGSPPEPLPELVPVLLRVNRETRALALSRYEPAFRWKTPHVMLPQQGDGATGARWSRPSTWFNFDLDTLYLLGQLEPCDSYGFNSPMAYFLDREEARRVRRLAVAFAALKYGEMAPQHIFGSLFHCVDRFPRAVEYNGRVLVAVTPNDEFTNALMGGEQPLVPPADDADVDGGGRRDGVGVGGGGQGRKRDEVNIVQKTWRDWYRGSIVKSSLASVQFELVREEALPQLVVESTKASGAKS
ncbi:hypothetical protein GGR52DRAFT_526917 [Hypoxylon sp. FL1284]|nr:hypothetical protein GGR52DRAFT_526917 [Hypoxylon sp. FL1284]